MLKNSGKILPETSLLQARQSQLTQLLLVWQMMQSLIVFMAHQWKCSSTSLSFLCWWAQIWIQHSRCGLSNTKQSRRITSLDLLATVFLNAAQDAVVLLWHKGTLLVRVQLVVHQDPWALLCKVAFQTVGSQAWGYSSPGAVLSISQCW